MAVVELPVDAEGEGVGVSVGGRDLHRRFRAQRVEHLRERGRGGSRIGGERGRGGDIVAIDRVGELLRDRVGLVRPAARRQTAGRKQGERAQRHQGSTHLIDDARSNSPTAD